MRPGTKNLLSLTAAFLTVWLAARFLLPLFAPFVAGTVLALAAEPVVCVLHKRLRVPRAVSAGIGVSMAFLLLAMAVLSLCAVLVRELTLLAGVLPDMEQTARAGISMAQGWLLELSEKTPRGIQPLLRENIRGLFSDGASWLDRLMGYLLGFTGNLLSHIPDSALGLGTAVISGCMISAKLPRIRKWCLQRIPEQRRKAIAGAAKRMKGAVLGWLSAQARLMGVTFGILLLGFVILKIRYAPLWAVGISLVDAFPVLGTGTVLLPWAVLSLMQGDGARAVGLAGIYLVVSLIRSTLEPKLLGRHLGLDPLVTLMAIYAGYRLWGITGMILAPLLAVTAIQVVPERKGEDLQ